VKNSKAALKLECLETREVPSAVTWTGNGSTLYWSNNGNWNTNHHPVSGDSVSIPANVNSFQDVANLKLGNLILNGGDSLALTEPLTLDGNVVGAQILGQGSAQSLIYGGGGLTITGGNPIFEVDGGSSVAISATISGNTSLEKTGNGTLELDNDNSYTGYTYVTAGVLALNDPYANSHALPNTTLYVGQGLATSATVKLLRNNQLNDSASISLNSDGGLDLNGFSDTVGPLSLVGGSGVTTGTGTMTLNGGIGLDIGTFNTPVLVTGNISLGSTDQVFNVLDAAPGSSLVLNGVISGGPNAGILKTGPGVLELHDAATTANTYGGHTWVKDGVLALNDNGADDAVSNQLEIGDGTGAAGSAVLRLWQSSEIPTSATVTVHSDGVLDLNGHSQTVGPLTLDGGAAVTTGTGVLFLGGDVTRAAAGSAPATITGNLDLGTTARTFIVPHIATGNDLVINGVVAGGAGTGLVKDGTGVLELDESSSAANTYGGITWVKDGVLALNDNGTDNAVSNQVEIGDGTGAAGSAVLRLLQSSEIPGSAAISIHGDGLLDLNGHNQQVGPITLDGEAEVMTGNGALVLNGDVTVPAVPGTQAAITGNLDLAPVTRTFTVAANTTTTLPDLTIAGSIFGGSAGLIKNGDGTLEIVGSITATGTTTLNAGSLWLDTNQSSSPVLVTGGTLGGFGTAGPVTATGGTVIPGDNSPGTLSTGNLILGATTFAPTLGGAAAGQFGQLAVTGSVTLTGAVLAPVLTFTPTPGQQFEVIANDGTDPVSGTFGNLPEGATFPLAGGTFQITYQGGDGNDVVLTDLTPVPPVPPTGPPTGPPTVPPTGPSNHLIATAADAGGPGTVVVYTATGAEAFTLNPFPGFTGGIRVATADVNGDGTDDVIAATGPGGPGLVAVFDGATQQELFRTQPFESSFTGGLYVAAGDLTGSGRADVVVTPDEGGGPRVTVFDGATFARIADFFGIDDPNFRGGARAAVGDVAGKGYGDLIVAAGFQGGPRVAGYDGKSVVAGNPQHVFGDFFAFEPTLRNGVFLTVGDVNGDGYADLIAGGGPGGGPRVAVFSGTGLMSNEQTLLANFFAGNPANRGGERVAAADLNGDGLADLITGPGPGGGSNATVYDGTQLGSGTASAALDLDPFPGFNGGVFVG
jgi:autotransporter-associated beta strand protein